MNKKEEQKLDYFVIPQHICSTKPISSAPRKYSSYSYDIFIPVAKLSFVFVKKIARMEDHILLYFDPELVPDLRKKLRRSHASEGLKVIIEKGKLCLITQGFKFHLERSGNFKELELWKTIDWNALVKVSDISHVYGIHEKCDAAEQYKYLSKSKLGFKQIDKEAETEIMPVVNGDNFTAFRTVLHFTEELVDE